MVIAGCVNDNDVRSGDLFFVGIPGDYKAEGMDSAILDATVSDELNLIHAGILDVDDEGIWVIDATIRHGVHRHPLDTLLKEFTLKDGSMPIFMVKRLRRGNKPVFVENAKAFCGQPYDCAFMPENGAMYCTELIRESYRTEDGSYIFPEKPMNFKNSDGEFPPYWTWLFGLLGMEIPQDVPGTNPHDMAILPILKDVDTDLVSLRRD